MFFQCSAICVVSFPYASHARKYPKVISIKHPHQNHHHQSLPLFLHPRLQGFLQSPLCFGLPQFHPMTCSDKTWQRCWAKVRSHGAFDQLRHQQSKSQFRGLRRRFRRNFHGYRFAMPWIWDLVKNCAWKLLVVLLANGGYRELL